MLYKIRLELARCKEHPEGASDIGYEFAAPLTVEGRIDADAYGRDKARCRVVTVSSQRGRRHWTSHPKTRWFLGISL